MFTKTLLATTLALGLALAPVSAQQVAQIDLSGTQSVADPITKLKPTDWVRLMTAEVDGSSVVGKPFVYFLNATGQEITTVLCGTYQLVGPHPYIPDAPNRLKPWKTTLVPTKGFDGYCKAGLKAQSDNGIIYKVDIVSADGSFSNATFLTVMP